MWPQTYTPVSENLPLSAFVAALPVFVVLILLGILRKPAWMAAFSGLGIAAAVALLVYRMPVSLVASSCQAISPFCGMPLGAADCSGFISANTAPWGSASTA